MPRRIVSLSPGATETLFALGLGDDVVGVSAACDYPDAASKPRVGEPANFDARRVLDLKPDLVVAGGAALRGLEQRLEPLRSAGLEVHVMRPRDLAGVLEEFLRLGLLTGRHREASELIDATRARLEAAMASVPGEVPRPRVYLETLGQPPTTVAEGIWVHDLIAAAGGTNIYADAPRPEPEAEPGEVAARDPEVAVLAWQGQRGKSPSLDEVLARPGWAAVAAAKAGRVHVLDDALFTRPGPRVVEGLERLVALLHPGKA